jgi:hypothetical protein
MKRQNEDGSPFRFADLRVGGGMSEFWWGVLSLPIIAVAVAAAASAVFGGWLLIEKWSIGRWHKISAAETPHMCGTPKFPMWAAPNLGRLGAYTSLMAAGARGFDISIGAGKAIIFVSATAKDAQRARLISRAIERAMIDIAITWCARPSGHEGDHWPTQLNVDRLRQKINERRENND